MGKAIFITGDRGKVQLFYCIKLILWIQFEEKGQASWGNPSLFAIFLAPKKFSSELAASKSIFKDKELWQWIYGLVIRRKLATIANIKAISLIFRHQEVAIDAKIDSLAARFYSDIWCQSAIFKDKEQSHILKNCQISKARFR